MAEYPRAGFFGNGPDLCPVTDVSVWCRKGTIVLVHVPFTDLSATKSGSGVAASRLPGIEIPDQVHHAKAAVRDRIPLPAIGLRDKARIDQLRHVVEEVTAF